MSVTWGKFEEYSDGFLTTALIAVAAVVILIALFGKTWLKAVALWWEVTP